MVLKAYRKVESYVYEQGPLSARRDADHDGGHLEFFFYPAPGAITFYHHERPVDPPTARVATKNAGSPTARQRAAAKAKAVKAAADAGITPNNTFAVKMTTSAAALALPRDQRPGVIRTGRPGLRPAAASP